MDDYLPHDRYMCSDVNVIVIVVDKVVGNSSFYPLAWKSSLGAGAGYSRWLEIVGRLSDDPSLGITHMARGATVLAFVHGSNGPIRCLVWFFSRQNFCL